MTDSIASILDEAVNSGRFLGVGFIAIDRSGKRIYSGAHGKRTFTSSDPLTLDTAGFLASMTKLVTSVAALQIVEAGLVGLDDDLGPIVPELGDRLILTGFDDEKQEAVFTEPTEKITMRRLLTHTSGFTYDQRHPDLYKWVVANGKEGEIFSGEFKANVRPLTFNPGSSWVYGPGIDWAGKVVEVLTKQTLEEYMNANIWSKLGMVNTTFHPERIPDYSLMDMGMRLNGPDAPLVLGSNPLGIMKDDFGGAGLYSSANDYIKFLAALLSDEGLLLSQDSTRELVSPQLGDASKQKLQDRKGFEIPSGIELDHGLGGMLYMDDVPERRKKGSMCWDGMTNPLWMLDRSSGVAMMLFVQILPSADLATKQLWVELEKAVYRSI